MTNLLEADLDTNDAECPVCGYGLRGLRSDRCPECGALLRLTVGSPRPVHGLWLASVILLSLTTGFLAFMLVFLCAFIAGGAGWRLLAESWAFSVGSVVGAAGIVAACVGRRRFVSARSRTRWVIALSTGLLMISLTGFGFEMLTRL